MKTSFFAGVLLSLSLAVCAFAGPRDAQWKKVDEAMRAGLPKTAIELLEPILQTAIADQAYAEAIKALGQKIALEGTIQGEKAEEKIVRLQAEIPKVPAAMKPAMEAILAHWYWQYFQQNRWRISQRTQTGGAAGAGTDLQTWDLARILAEIDQHFTAALADEAGLKTTPITAYDDLLEKGTVPDAYRPTMFDFLAYEALAFYQAGELGAIAAEDEFEIDAANTPIFAEVPEFLNWKIPDSARMSPKAKAIVLYQKLLAFHRNDRDPSAYFDAELGRLKFGKNAAIGEALDDRYKAALRRLADDSRKKEFHSHALAALAQQLHDEKDLVSAHTLAKRGYDLNPESAGGALCYNIAERIEAKSAQLITERVWTSAGATLEITYRNVTAAYFRAIPIDVAEYCSKFSRRYGPGDILDRARLLSATSYHEWSAPLPPTKDFKERTESLTAPSDLKRGLYAILVSHDPAFNDSRNQISTALVWVTDLALITAKSQRKGMQDGGIVLNANSGEPVSGATIQVIQEGPNNTAHVTATVKTDENGRFQAALEGHAILLAEHAGDRIGSWPDWFRHSEEEDDDDQHTRILTDRAIYRPGQSIHFKGISMRYDTKAGKYVCLPRKRVTVEFVDSNGESIQSSKHTTNDYGSFTGVFTAPRDRLTGQMSLRVDEGPTGHAFIQVEEYKRPKFHVAVEAPTDASKLGREVRVTGRASAYTGAPVDGAKVRWSVTRSTRFPPWCWWSQPLPTKAIAHGTATTAADGTFSIEFSAEPDRSVPEKDEPKFNFVVHAEVTDVSGETRSAEHTVRIGYTALEATISAEEWLPETETTEFQISTKSLDGVPLASEGEFTISTLRQPDKVRRGPMRRTIYRGRISGAQLAQDPTNPDSWDSAQTLSRQTFKTQADGTAHVRANLKAGIYRAYLETKDKFGKRVTALQTFEVIAPQDQKYRVNLPHKLQARSWSVEPGETFSALWGTGYETGRALVEFECDGKVIQSYWTAADRTQQPIELPITESMRGGVTLRVVYVRENRDYSETQVVEVPWSNKDLTVKWESFRSKLQPGQKETWTAVITDSKGKAPSAEFVASLYDASLDQFKPHGWPASISAFRREYSRWQLQFQNSALPFQIVAQSWGEMELPVRWRYRSFAGLISESVSDTVLGHGGEMELSQFVVQASPGRGYAAAMAGTGLRTKMAELHDDGPARPAPPPPDAPDLTKVSARKNLNETAFFFPQLLSDENGVVKISFTIPEALTEWKFLGFAHDKQLRSGFLTDKVVTSKDLMVEPNPPRFVREGDAIEFTVKVTNQSAEPQSGRVKLTFADAATLASVDHALGNQATEQAFDVPSHQSRNYTWRIAIPDGMGFLTYKVVGASRTASDGEEGYLPVLSRRILVTESLPLPIRGAGTREFAFEKLLASGGSNTLRHQSLKVEMVSQPAWYAVMALPYLMEFPYECNEQTFNRFYANALARHVANGDPKIRRIFDLWKNTPALDSPLQKNEDIKSVLLEETPWLRQANKESEARRNVGVLFDRNRLDEESERTLRKLSENQLNEGLWSWFPGGPPSPYISLYIATGFGRLRHLGAEVDVTAAVKALDGIDEWMRKEYRDIRARGDYDNYVPSSTDALYLYGRSFFLKDHPVGAANREAVEFFIARARDNWVKVDSRQSQAHLAIALQRFGDKSVPQAIMKSLGERAVHDDELGMYWRDSERSWWWYHAPIETQALMIEAFAEVSNDASAVESCKVWLLKQKQTQNWKTTKATADAVYALLLRGENLLASDARVEVSLGGEVIRPERVEAGTGYYAHTFARESIKPELGRVTVTKSDAGVSWGSVHWQYLEDMAKVTPYEGTPLKLKKALFVKETTSRGPVLKPVNGAVSVGDEVVVRVELRVDRDMEYVHLKDQRGSGTEPVNVLSRYKYQDGLAYYESTRDTATHFFIDYLPKGVYVFEYSVRVQLSGTYQSGIAEIQCMYAPEFNSHSESVEIEAKR